MSSTGAPPGAGFQGLQQRALDQELPRKDVLLHRLDRSAVATAPTELRQSDADHLPGIVPLVDGRRDVQPLVALQSHEPASEHPRRGPRATSVFPTPASPSRKSGRRISRVRNAAVARLRPATYSPSSSRATVSSTEGGKRHGVKLGSDSVPASAAGLGPGEGGVVRMRMVPGWRALVFGFIAIRRESPSTRQAKDLRLRRTATAGTSGGVLRRGSTH